MTSTAPATQLRPRNLWIDAQTIVLEEHESILDEAVCSLSGLDVIFHSFPALVLDGISKTDLVILHMVHPKLDLGRADPEFALVFDEGNFEAVKTTIKSLGSHITCHRLVAANISLRSVDGLRKLRRIMAKRPRVFGYGLQRVV